MKDVINTLNAAILQFWPKAKLLSRHQYGSGEPASYWYMPNPEELDLIRIFPRWERGSFYLSCFRSPDQETFEMFARDLQRFGSDMLMLPYSLQNMEVGFQGSDFLISKVGTITSRNTTLLVNSSQLIFYTANGFR
jgi:hypothetical protein